MSNECIASAEAICISTLSRAAHSDIFQAGNRALQDSLSDFDLFCTFFFGFFPTHTTTTHNQQGKVCGIFFCVHQCQLS